MSWGGVAAGGMLAGLGGGILGGMAGASNMKKFRSDLMKMYAPIMGSNAYQFGLAELYQQKVLDKVQGGYDEAMKATERYGTVARRSAVDAGKQLLGSTEQNLASRGLGNTTVRDSMRRGVVSDTQRRIQEIDSATGGQLGQLQTGKTQAEAVALQALAQLQMQRAQMDTGVLLDQIQTYAGAYAPSTGEILGGALGQLGGGLMGLSGMMYSADKGQGQGQGQG